MKTERRRELQTNVLSQQIDDVGTYVRENALRLIAVFTATIVLVGGSVWYIKGRQSRIMEGWATLADSSLTADPVSAVGRFRGVAAQGGNADLTIAAWLRIGDLAMGQLAVPTAVDEGEENSAELDWRQIAREAYEKVLEIAGSREMTARGQALMMLGVLAEDRGEFEDAREYYLRIVDDEALALTPLPLQAEYRLEGLARWSEPVTFPPALVTVPAPAPGPDPSAHFVPSPEQGTTGAQPFEITPVDVVIVDDEVPGDDRATDTPELPPAQEGDEN